jgi:acyl dehydratase
MGNAVEARVEERRRAPTGKGVDDFVRDSVQLIGQEATDVLPGADVADWLNIRRFCAALGDPNPLYKDPSSGLATKYNSMIAPNTFVYAIRTPNSTAAYSQKDYGVAPFFARGTTSWVDIIRVGDRLKSSIRVADVREGAGNHRRTAEVVSEVEYRNSYGGLIGGATGVVALYPYDRERGELLLERDIHQYSDAEIRRIERDLAAVVTPRGKQPRYWDEVSVGETLPQLVKGPVSLADMMAWVIAEAKDMGLGSIVYRDLIEKFPGRIRTNPTTDWPYWDADQEFEDILSSRSLGFKMPVTRGQQRVCLAAQICTSWMGDDGFLRRLDVSLPTHWVYGDTMWLTGVVAQKRTEQLGRETYFAADVSITGTNQLGENILTGTATVYLPRPGQAVTLPIPH